jgi:hypothetical protein
MPADDRQQLAAELAQLNADTNYQAFRPILEKAEMFVNAQSRDTEWMKSALSTAAELLRAVKAGGAAVQNGQDPREFIDDLVQGHTTFYQPGLQADNVTQAGRDVVNLFLKTAAPEIKPAQSMRIPIVLVAMTVPEAQALVSGNAFNGEPAILLGEFQEFRAHLQEIGINGWDSHYGNAAEDWKPNGSDRIADLISNALQGLNAAGIYTKPLIAKYYDLRALVTPANTSGLGELPQLRREGCIVIVDAISTRHPLLLRAFQRSLLDIFPSTSVLSVAPQRSVFDILNNMIYGLQVNLIESEWFRRLNDYTEPYVCHRISNFSEFPKWLANGISRIHRSSETGGAMINQIKHG